MQELLTRNHIISFEDFQKATGYERHERVDYFQKSKNDLQIESDSDEDTESFISVASYDRLALQAELNSMMQDVELRNDFIKPAPTKHDSGESDELQDSDGIPGDPEATLCLVDDDIDESAGIQGVTTLDYSKNMAKNKSYNDVTKAQSSKTMGKLMGAFEEETL